MTRKPALLVLSDGTVKKGLSIGAEGSSVGELVFNTAMTGYQEILTDPSYCGQIVTLTAPHIGNTGYNKEDMESSRIWASGLVVRHCTTISTHYLSEGSLSDWLKSQNVVAIEGVDTRALTLLLREKGAIGCCITTDVDNLEQAKKRAKAFKGLVGENLSAKVSRTAPAHWDEGRGRWATRSTPVQYKVVAYDFGVKHNLLRIMQDMGCDITVVPATTSVKDVLALKPHGIFLSNGPGDPAACVEAIEAARYFIEHNIPLFGVCLGFQILALALGAQSFKMKFGHHGANHPVASTDLEKRVFISSQNHGFAIDEATLPHELIVTHRSLFDNTLQGIRHRTKPVFGFQGHPEASPGPHDLEGLFDIFVDMMKDFSKGDNNG